MKTRWNLLLAALLFAVFAPLLLADNVKTDYDHHANFERYHTYSWQQVKTEDPLWVDRIKEAVDHQLQSKGWQLVPSGGDVSVFAVGNAQDRQQLQTFYDGFGGGWGWGRWGRGGDMATTTTEHYEVGTLVLDLFDSSNKQLVWRGSSSGILSNKSDKNIHKLDGDVKKMFQDFPPRSRD